MNLFGKESLLKFFKTRSLQFYLLLLLVAIAAFLRFYNYPYRYGLGEESVRDAVIGIEGARQLQFPLTGAFSSLGPFTFGPWYQYQLIVATLLLQHMYAPWIYLSIISVLYIVVVYKIGELLINKNFGLILAILAAFSPAQVISATHLTSHNTTNLFAVLAIWIFLRLVKKKLSAWWGFALGFVIGVGINLHFQMAGLLVFPLLLLLYKPKRYLYFITSIGGVFVSFLPLLFFEFNNHWFNVKNMYFYMLHTRTLMYVPNRWLFYLRDFWPAFWADALGVPAWLAATIIIGFLISFGFAIYKKKITAYWTLLLIAFLFIFILLRYYWGPKSFGYLNFVRPFVFIFTGYIVYSLSRIKFGVYTALGIVLAIILFSTPRNIFQMQPDPFSMKIYKAVDEVFAIYPKEKFQVYECGKKFSSAYNAEVFSVLFVLDLHKRLGDKIKLGISGGGCENPISEKGKGSYLKLSTTGILDFSALSENEIKDSNWKKVTMSSLYDVYARWWFKLQP